jgi:hypothetical protein
MKVNFIEIFGAITTVGTQAGIKVIRALEDDVLDGPELASIIKTAIRALRMAGVSHKDLDQVQVATTRAEYEMIRNVNRKMTPCDNSNLTPL